MNIMKKQDNNYYEKFLNSSTNDESLFHYLRYVEEEQFYH